ncbi:uncharacterized protein LOC126903921 isoform X2 [Daktulosphaira vitifoliae]|uniref:uncharacterized protein LOC126903921 isoform X2 n=1 Tax=Daktulosphaira vitifoliae TaxID=58002 RepID=UPI0021A9968F|nr:uncharacterized protein LOC126903921 isoform X2 [Daktulosphaira vitifoliae]
MFTARVSHEGETFRISSEIVQQSNLFFHSAVFRLPTSDSIDVDFDEANINLIDIQFDVNMDPNSEKCGEARLVPMPQFLINNPNISILPARNLQSSNTSTKPSPVSSVNKVSRGTSSSISEVPVTQEQTVINDKIIQKNTDPKVSSKRNISDTVDDKPFKVPRLSVSKLSQKKVNKVIEQKVALKPIKTTKTSTMNDATKKLSSPTKFSNIQINKQSLPNLTNRVVPHTPTKSTVNLTRDVLKNAASLENEKNACEKIKTFEVTINGSFMNQRNIKKEENKITVQCESEAILVLKNNQIIDISEPDLVDNLLLCIGAGIKKYGTKEAYDTVKESNIIHSPEHNWSLEYGNNSKQNSPNLNNRVNQVNKQQLQLVSNQHPSTSKSSLNNQMSLCSKIVKTNIVSQKVAQSPKHNDIKVNSLGNSQFQTSKTFVSTIPQAPIVSKQVTTTTTTTTQSSPSKLTVPTTGTVQLPNKGTVGQQSSIDKSKQIVLSQSITSNLNKCSKCEAISDDDLCTTCRVSSHLKGVTVTRIETPATPVSTNDSSVILLSSEDEEEDLNESEEISFSMEPVINKVESVDVINEYISKISLNPMHLEDKLSQTEYNIKDVFKFENCRSIRIGNFKTTPHHVGEVIICLHGIRMAINDSDFRPVTIDLQMENIVKILAFYGEKMPTIIIYTTYLASTGIRHLLAMSDNDKSYYYDPTSKDNTIKKIIWTFGLKKNEGIHLEKLLQKLPKGKYEPMTMDQANELLVASCVQRDNKKYKKKIEKIRNTDYNNTEIINFNVDNNNCRVSIFDYTGLSVDEYLNDALVDFYLKYWFTRHVSEEDKKRSYLFSTFFYTRLTTPKGGIDKAESKAQCRHERVKKWTKNVNIFEKDFIFVPINENYHWYLAVICYPYLTGPINMEDGTPIDIPDDEIDQFEPIDRPLSPCMENTDRDEVDGNSEDLKYFNIDYDCISDNRNSSSYEEDVEELKKMDRPLIKQPCILIFDSLYGGTHRAKIVATLREYLAEEYQAKHNGARRVFPKSILKGAAVKVPQQTNYFDCGLFVLHFFEKFFECPIVDFSFPILHLQNWFSCDDVTGNAKKRKDFQKIVLNIMNEQGRKVDLPTLKFVSSSNSNTIAHHRGIHQYNHYYEEMDYEEMDSGEEDSDIEGEDDEIYEEESDEYMESNLYHDYAEDGEEEDYHDYKGTDPREFYAEMEENDESFTENDQWSEVQTEGEEFHNEREYNREELSDYQVIPERNIIVDEDESDDSSSNHRNISQQNRVRSENDNFRTYQESENEHENLSPRQIQKSQRFNKKNSN